MGERYRTCGTDGDGNTKYRVQTDVWTIQVCDSCEHNSVLFSNTARDFGFPTLGLARVLSNPQANNFARTKPTAITRDVRRMPRNGIYTFAEDEEGDCENRPLNGDHVINGGRTEPPQRNPTQVDQFGNGSFPSYLSIP